ncbi:trypsin-like peptidase domain-containing protein [Alloacidobacterium dinghuense]|uniref:Trypsin-like peptidase domain-containing protein n=1 Tax=Alloacidobacterium dinghuense TaxID=2763107 RepID=A0A7G8BJ44_9BACT|nr:trypsin-like peptidase domain-containing protein [Alloacidobacterium dinghuense]QNI32564.1 trypsin-like peptidase domain-containing protein [Alloacidobacterium dinghuense]
MNDQNAKLLVVESDDLLREALAATLRDSGYEVSTDYSGGMKAVLAFEPDLVILGADPPQLDCCDLLSEIKGSKHTRNVRVVMLVHGSSAERTRGLDLGADDALSLPLDPPEFLSRIRSQLKSKQVADELGERLRLTEEHENTNRQVVTAVNEERRTLLLGAVAIVAVLIIVGLVSFSFYRRGHAENVRVYAAITRLQTGALSQQSLMQRSLQSLGNETARTTSSQPEDNVALKDQVSAVEGRLQKLETEGKAAHTIIEADEPSVCLIHVALAFRDHDTGLKLHYAALTSTGEPETDKSNNPLVSLTGIGPEVHLDVFGTGFLASDDGQILTNHHVAEPWWQNDEIKEMLDQGLDPEIAEMTAYFPSVTHGISITTKKISSDADVALVKGNVSGLGIRHIALADGRDSAVGGSPVLLLGYPTGVDAILARTGAATLQAIAASSKGDPKEVMEELAHRHLIKPVATQGHIGDVLPDKIIYDAQTTHGGSGGPLFNDQGQVIGINFAMVRDFGGSNFAIPARFAESLLKP